MGWVPVDCGRRAWAEHKARLEVGIVPLVPAPVIAEVSRSPQQAQLRRFLAGGGASSWRKRGAQGRRLLRKAKTQDVVDAAVATTALRGKAAILTSDPKDIGRLAGVAWREGRVIGM